MPLSQPIYELIKSNGCWCCKVENSLPPTHRLGMLVHKTQLKAHSRGNIYIAPVKHTLQQFFHISNKSDRISCKCVRCVDNHHSKLGCDSMMDSTTAHQIENVKWIIIIIVEDCTKKNTHAISSRHIDTTAIQWRGPIPNYVIQINQNQGRGFAEMTYGTSFWQIPDGARLSVSFTNFWYCGGTP